MGKRQSKVFSLPGSARHQDIPSFEAVGHDEDVALIAKPLYLYVMTSARIVEDLFILYYVRTP